jgi:hypothetical protein
MSHVAGKHYFQDLKKDGTCDAHRPYFLLYGPYTNKLNGFGITMYGKVSQGRGWFETPPALVAKVRAREKQQQKQQQTSSIHLLLATVMRQNYGML